MVTGCAVLLAMWLMESREDKSSIDDQDIQYIVDNTLAEHSPAQEHFELIVMADQLLAKANIRAEILRVNASDANGRPQIAELAETNKNRPRHIRIIVRCRTGPQNLPNIVSYVSNSNFDGVEPIEGSNQEGCRVE